MAIPGSGERVGRHGRRERVVEFWGLEPNLVAASAAMFLLGCGENLWRRFLPKYLESLGAPVAVIAAGTAVFALTVREEHAG